MKNSVLTVVAVLTLGTSAFANNATYLLYKELNQLRLATQGTQGEQLEAVIGYDVRNSKITRSDNGEISFKIHNPLLAFDGLVDSYKYSFFTDNRLSINLASRVCDSFVISNSKGQTTKFALDDKSLELESRKGGVRIASCSDATEAAAEPNVIATNMNGNENFWVQTFTCVSVL